MSGEDREAEFRLTYTVVKEPGKQCAGCGAALEVDEAFVQLTFGHAGVEAVLCDACHDSLAEQSND